MSDPVLSSGPAPPSLSPLDAVAEMRASAKWIVVALAAAGAALLGGGPIAAAGKINDLSGAIVACVGLIIALVGIGLAIWWTAEALIPPLTTPQSIDTEPSLADLRQRVSSEPQAFYGPFGHSMTDLGRSLHFHQTVARNLSRMLSAETPPDRRTTLTTKLEEATETVAAIKQRSVALLQLAHAWQVRDQLRKARLRALIGAAIAAFGATIFLATTIPATTDPAKPQPSPTATASRSTSPKLSE
ncbi:hypothetical protein ACSDR0_45685 [Streptosporangium sp. G11]|uniref:hypothetical protein n=1 Tax=Streptosporangium sp. G11 TaxID=3436926 RepID=UPI003EC04158